MFAKPWQQGAAITALFVLMFSAIAIGSQPRGTVSAEDTSTDRTISVNGQGQVTLTPDFATISLGVETTANTANDAMQQNAAVMGSVVEQIKALGVEEQHIKTTGVSLYPYFDNYPKPLDPSQPQPGAPIMPDRLQRFRASNNVNVTLYDLSKVAQVIDTTVAKGANLVSGVNFGVADHNAGQARALEAAMDTARARADVLASKAGVAIIGVKSVSDGGYSGGPIPFADGRGAAPTASTPIQPGQLTVSANVSVVYLIG